MKSLVDDALNNRGQAGNVEMDSSDEELMKLVDALKVNITIIGCGGGGSNTIRRLNQAGIFGAQLVAANTDARHLLLLNAPHKVLLGRRLTRGLGAGAIPEVGSQAAEEARDDLRKYVDHSDIVFITAGMGGGTGTGSAPVVAELAKQNRSLVMAVVTLPFKSEGTVRMQNALRGLERIRNFADTTIVVPNDKLLEIVPRLPLDAAFRVADEVLAQCIKGITEIVTKPGLVNIDFADIKTIMGQGGVAMIGMGESCGPKDERVEEALKQALTSPLLGDVDIREARGALIRVVGGSDMTLKEAQRVVEAAAGMMGPSARVIWGCSVEPESDGRIKVLVVITGVKSPFILPQGPAQKKDIDFI
ncbi:MAG: cell division protein FtsZ [Methanomassiliicoccales archaeon]